LVARTVSMGWGWSKETACCTAILLHNTSLTKESGLSALA
jgi:hypothetical protein